MMMVYLPCANSSQFFLVCMTLWFANEEKKDKRLTQ